MAADLDGMSAGQLWTREEHFKQRAENLRTQAQADNMLEAIRAADAQGGLEASLRALEMAIDLQAKWPEYLTTEGLAMPNVRYVECVAAGAGRRLDLERQIRLQPSERERVERIERARDCAAAEALQAAVQAGEPVPVAPEPARGHGTIAEATEADLFLKLDSPWDSPPPPSAG